jgi:hypothetical protein
MKEKEATVANQDICNQCGTVIDAGDPSGLCAQCGTAKEGAGAGEGGGGAIEPPVQYDSEPHGNEPFESFPTRPAGVGNTEDNAEIKVRR